MTNVTCAFGPCFRLPTRAGFCHTHYMQKRRGKTLAPIREYGTRTPAESVPRAKPSLTRDEQGRKRCGPCGQWLSVDQFHVDPRPADGLSGLCTRCSNLTRFKLTRTSYEAMLTRQNGACAFCSKPHTEDDPLRVDHDHSCCPGRGSCGKCVRWLLCNGCNTGLGNFQEDEAALLAAVERLRAWRAR